MKPMRREPELRELMDDPQCDPDRLRRTLRGFGAVNLAVSRWGTVYRTHVAPLLSRLPHRARILDIGCGGGDVLRRLTGLARRDGFAVEALGIDPDPRALEVAGDAERTAGLSFRRAYSRDLVEEGARFDLVLSNHLLHHLGEEELAETIADSEALATGLCLHSDIARSRAAYLAFSLLAAPVAPGTFLRVDGLRSIRRSYTAAELDARLPQQWSVEQPGRFRLLAVHRAAGGRP